MSELWTVSWNGFDQGLNGASILVNDGRASDLEGDGLAGIGAGLIQGQIIMLAQFDTFHSNTLGYLKIVWANSSLFLELRRGLDWGILWKNAITQWGGF